MFQNINEGMDFNNQEEKNESKKASIFTNVFAKKNLLVYIVSFMLALVGLDGEFSIFSISMLGACFASSVPALGIILLSLVGNMIKYGVGGALGYFLTTLVLVTSMLIFKPRYNEKERNEKIKIGKNVFIAIAIIHAIKFTMAGFTLYDILSGITMSIIGLVFYKIFVNSIVILQDFKVKRAFSIEELVGASIIFSIAVAAFGDLNIMGFGIRNILSILIVMILRLEKWNFSRDNLWCYNRCYIRSNYWLRTDCDCSLCNIWYDSWDIK